MHIKTQYVKVTLLSWEEEAIEEIQGKVISGNVNLDGNSAIRRTAQLSLFIPSSEVDYANAASLISINKKIKLEIGIKNTLNKYIDYDIDYKIFTDKTMLTLDLDEYQLHKKQMHYPKEIDDIIKEEMQNIREQVQNNQAPFNREIVEKYFADYLSQLTSQ